MALLLRLRLHQEKVVVLSLVRIFVLTVSHNFIKDQQDGNIRKVVDNDKGDGDIFSISYPGLDDVKFSKKDVIHWDRDGYLKGYKNDLALVRLRTVLENAPVEVT